VFVPILISLDQFNPKYFPENTFRTLVLFHYLKIKSIANFFTNFGFSTNNI
jgi:hypothetical protein